MKQTFLAVPRLPFAMPGKGSKRIEDFAVSWSHTILRLKWTLQGCKYTTVFIWVEQSPLRILLTFTGALGMPLREKTWQTWHAQQTLAHYLHFRHQPGCQPFPNSSCLSCIWGPGVLSNGHWPGCCAACWWMISIWHKIGIFPACGEERFFLLWRFS